MKEPAHYTRIKRKFEDHRSRVQHDMIAIGLRLHALHGVMVDRSEMALPKHLYQVMRPIGEMAHKEYGRVQDVTSELAQVALCESLVSYCLDLDESALREMVSPATVDRWVTVEALIIEDLICAHYDGVMRNLLRRSKKSYKGPWVWDITAHQFPPLIRRCGDDLLEDN